MIFLDLTMPLTMITLLMYIMLNVYIQYMNKV